MSATKHHVSVNIAGVLRNYGKRSMAGLMENKGQKLSNQEARQYIQSCLDKGWEIIPCCEDSECPTFDHFGGGCPGHPVEEPLTGFSQPQIGTIETIKLNRPIC